MPIPILIMSDAPDTTTGLGRITRDLAFVLSEIPEFRVGTFGRGGIGSKKLSWAQYTFPESEQWGEGLLIKACEDFAGNDNFIIFTIWDVSRLFWFSCPTSLPANDPLTTFLLSDKFQRWGYFPIDASGPGKKLSTLSHHALAGYDRLLAYSQFGRDIISSTGVDWQSDYIPHGIHQTTFYDRGREQGRELLRVIPDCKLVGCVMTNQARKDWGLWAQTAKILIDQDPSYMFWAHIDTLERYWSLPALIEDFGLSEHVRVTQAVTDDTLAKLYSACDLTVLPSLGEGFGYPIAESLACGTPVVHHDYAAGQELIKFGGLVSPKTFRLDTLHNIFRPVFIPEDWARKINFVIYRDFDRAEVAKSVDHLHWDKLKYVWKNWFLQGLNE